MRRCAATSTDCTTAYSLTFSYTKSGTAVSPAFFTYYPSSGTITSNSVTIAPNSSTQMGTYIVKVTFMPTNKLATTSLPQYTAYTLYVGCYVTGLSDMVFTGLSTTFALQTDANPKTVDFSTSTVSPTTT